jgi:hypothetical protein
MWVELWAYSSKVEIVIFWLCGSSWNRQAASAVDQGNLAVAHIDVARHLDKWRLGGSHDAERVADRMPIPRHPKEKFGGARLIAIEDGGRQQIEVLVLLDRLAIQQHRGYSSDCCRWRPRTDWAYRSLRLHVKEPWDRAAMRHAQPFPVLTTERLKLRAVQSSDGSFYHQLLSVAEVTRFSDLPDFRMFGRVAADPID